MNLNSVLEETLILVSASLQNRSRQRDPGVQTELPPVLGSTNRLQQVFLNLFMNARDAMPDGGMLEVRTCVAEWLVEVEVADTGLGIPHENI